jgi:serine/threonine protein kinase
MADVYIARNAGVEGFQRHVVLKCVRPDRSTDARFVEMLLDEARLAAALHHQNIVQVHDIGQESGEYFFTMEYVHGQDLRGVLKFASQHSTHVPFHHALTIAIGTAAGLHHAHEQRGSDRQPLGLVHRDVSPANVMIGYDGSVKVADFGIAKNTLRTTQTQTGTLKGKVSYMSPEQCTGRPLDRRSDIFSLGILLYELVTTRRLFKGDNDFITMSTIVQGRFPSPTIHRPDLPPALEQIIMRAMNRAPSERFQTAEEMRLALEDVASKLPLRSSNQGLADYMKSQFGTPLEPWLVEDDEPEIEVTDFDGSASGAAFLSTDELLLDSDDLESSPLGVARTRARTVAPPAKKKRSSGALLFGALALVLGGAAAVAVKLFVFDATGEQREAAMPEMRPAALPTNPPSPSVQPPVLATETPTPTATDAPDARDASAALDASNAPAVSGTRPNLDAATTSTDPNLDAATKSTNATGRTIKASKPATPDKTRSKKRRTTKAQPKDDKPWDPTSLFPK